MKQSFKPKPPPPRPKAEDKCLDIFTGGEAAHQELDEKQTKKDRGKFSLLEDAKSILGKGNVVMVGETVQGVRVSVAADVDDPTGKVLVYRVTGRKGASQPSEYVCARFTRQQAIGLWNCLTEILPKLKDAE